MNAGRLELLHGGVRVKVTWIVRMLASRHVPDVQIDRIDISYAARARAGCVSAEQHFHATPRDLDWTCDGARLLIHLRFPDLPWPDDVVLSPQECTFLGHSIWRRQDPPLRWTMATGAAAGGRDGTVTRSDQSKGSPSAPAEHQSVETQALPPVEKLVRGDEHEMQIQSLHPRDQAPDPQSPPGDRIAPCGLNAARADAAVRTPGTLLAGGLEACNRLTYEFDATGRPSIDNEVQLTVLVPAGAAGTGAARP